jgi:transcriptional regulator with GAF, ATPase, and Fis domain/serine/threonine protein kinase
MSDLPTINQRYVAVRDLTRSSDHANTTVYLVRDLQRAERLTALKIFCLAETSDGPDSGWAAARREFEILRRIRHPRVAEVYNLGRVEHVHHDVPQPSTTTGEESSNLRPPEAGDAFLASEFIAGVHLRDAFLHLFPDAESDVNADTSVVNEESRWTVFLGTLARIALGLGGIHAQGLIHHDIKPENLLVLIDHESDGDTLASPQLDAKIIDFGFAQSDTTPLGKEIRGTVPYMAPELIDDQFADGRSDLYSLGLSMYQAMTGKLPFGVRTVEEWLDVVQQGRELDLTALEADVPGEIIDIVRQLTRLDPAERYADAEALVDALEKAGNFRLVERSRSGNRRAATTGWENELSLLCNEIERLPRAETSYSAVVVSTDEDGDGDRFLNEAETLAALSETWCIRCSTQRPYNEPYGPVTAVLRQLMAELDLTSPTYRRFIPTLGRLLPELRSHPTGFLTSSTASPSYDEDRSRLEEFLAEFLLQVGTASPILILIDDLQRADRDTLELLQGLAETIHRRQTSSTEDLLEGLIPDEPRRSDLAEGLADEESHESPLQTRDESTQAVRVLLVGVVKGNGQESTPLTLDEHENQPPAIDLTPLEELGESKGTLSLRLENLDVGQIREWLSLCYPQSTFTPTNIQDLFETTSGSTRFLDEVLRDRPVGTAGADFEDGLDRSSPGRRLQSAAFSVAGSLGELLVSRLRGVHSQDRDVLEVLAVLGCSTSLDDFQRVLAHLAETETDSSDHLDLLNETAERVRRLVDLGLLVLHHEHHGLQISWTHDAVRFHVYFRIDDAHRRLLHGAVLDSSTAVDGELAAEHALAADDLTCYVERGMRAAEAFQDAASLDSAIRMYEDVLRNLGSAARGSDSDNSPRSANDPEESRWRVLKRLGDIYRDVHDYSRAIEKFTVLLSLEENDPDERRRSEIYRVLGQIYQENGDRSNAHFFLEKSLRILDGRPFIQARIDALLSLAEFHQLSGEADPAEEYSRRALEEINKHPDDENFARACLQLGTIYVDRQLFDYGLKYQLEALKAARRSGEISHILRITLALGETFAARGEYEKAIEQYTRSVELATLLGSKSTLAGLYNEIGKIQLNRANRPLALANFCRSLGHWQALGNQRGIAKCYNNLGLALVLQDDLQRASECYRRGIEIFARVGDENGQAAGMNNLAHSLELEGRYGEALDYAFRGLEKRKKFKTRSGVAFSYYCIGKIYQAKGEFDKAYSYSEKSLQIRRDIGEKMGIAYSKMQIAELLLLRGRLKASIENCDEGAADFEILENNYGLIVSREIKARIFMQLGEFGQSIEILEEVMTQARQSQEALLMGKALYLLGQIAIERREFLLAEQRLDRAEAIFRKNNYRRQLTELLLEKCRLYLGLENQDLAAKHLELAYSFLEELGIRDLIPLYFLLRGRCETEGEPRDVERGRKFLERAAIEAREAVLPDTEWKIHCHLGQIADEVQRPEEKHEQYQKALAILRSMIEGLPEELTRRFYEPPQRQLLEESGDDPAGTSLDPITEAESNPKTTPDPSTDDARGDRLRLQTEVHELKDLNRRLLKLQEINKAINSELDLPRLLEKILDAVLDLMDAERGYLILLESADEANDKGDDSTGPTAPQESVSVARNMDRESIKNPETKISRSITAEVIRSGTPVLTTNAVSDDRFIESRSVRDLQLLSVLCVPLRSQKRTLGALYLDNRHRRHAFKETDLALLETFSDQATTAIENARLSEEIQTRNVELTELNDQMETLNHRLLNQVHARTSELEVTRENLRQQMSKYESHLRFHNIIGKTGRMQQIFQVLERIAPTSLPVLIQGDSGTGKELVARAIYAHSTRKDKRFISENCAAISESLLESELFGHIRGAFTGATSERKGLFEIADGGTLFLDEVGETSLGMQTKLLRVLEESELRRVGDKKTVKIDVRIISASNHDLRQLVEDGKFREDLYYRLNGVRVDLPGLRERRDDIPLLVQHFLDEIAGQSNLPKKQITQEALLLLVNHDWPGNVRELKHFLERTALLLEGETIHVEDCHLDPHRMRIGSARGSGGPEGDARTPAEFEALLAQPLRDARDEFVKFYVKVCYSSNDFNATQAARACGMSRESFHRFLRKYDIRKDDLHSRN